MHCVQYEGKYGNKSRSKIASNEFDLLICVSHLQKTTGQRDIWDGYEYVDKRKWGSQRMAITHAEGGSAQLKLMSLQHETCTRVSDFLPHVIQMEKCSH